MLVITYNHIIRCIRSSCISACPMYCVHRVTGILHNSSLTRSHIITCSVVMVAVSLLTIRYLIILKSLNLILVLIKILALVNQHLALSLLDRLLALVTW